MSLKAELETWAAALTAYDDQDFEKALDLFSRISDSSKILTNMGLIYATVGEHDTAVQQFMAATSLDPYLAIAYFQCGVSNFLLNRYELALQNFGDALLCLRGNQTINYEQLGLKFQLYTPEVLFNKGLSKIYIGYLTEGLAEMEDARKLKITQEHNVIDDAIRDGGEGYTVFSIPVGVLYRPSENKIKNSKTRDYLGRAKLVAAADESDAFTEFTGIQKLKKAIEFQAGEGTRLRRSATVPPRIDSIDQPNLERSKTTNALEGMSMNMFSNPNPSMASRRTRSDTAGVPESTLSRSNTYAPFTVAPLRTKSSSALSAGSRAPNTRINETIPSQPLNQPGTIYQPSFALPNSYPGSPNQTQLSPRNQYQQFQPYQIQPSLPAGLPVPRDSFVLPAAAPSQEPPPAQQTDFYDEYINVYADDLTRPLERGLSASSLSRMGQGSPQSGPGTAGLNSSTSSSIRRTPSRGAYDAANGANIVRNVSARRPTRRPTNRRPRVTYEAEEGYVSGEYDEPYEAMSIRVKLHYQEEVRGMTFMANTSFKEFVTRVTSKFGTTMDGLGIKFKDEDDMKVTLRDSSDFELAIATARHNAKGNAEGKLEIWCTDLI